MSININIPEEILTRSVANTLQAAESASTIGKHFCEAGKANATRRLVNDVRREIPCLADNARRAMESAMELNQAQKVAVTETMNACTDAAGAFGTAAESVGRSAEMVTKDMNGIRIIGGSLVDRADYYVRFMQAAMMELVVKVYQGVQALEKIGEELGCIKEELMLANSIQVQGSGGEDGFAQHVYNFVQMRIAETDGKNHRFFVYHPDTDWYPAFRKLIGQNPLPQSFCAKSDNLDKLCLYMQSLREILIKECEDGKDIVFHLLIPAWSPIAILDPLHYPDDLQPFHVEGLKHQGKPYVVFNLPAAPKNLLDGVGNLLDPSGSNTTAAVASAATWLLGGTALNFGALSASIGVAAVAGGGPFVVIPLWLAGFGGIACPTALYASHTVHEYIAERPPRVLGSNRTI